MGTFNVAIQVGDLQRRRFEELEALADTGATTTVIPASVLEELGVTPTTSQTFEYASGEQVELDMGETRIRVESRETVSWVIFGNEDGGALLGAYTLEGVFLAVDPYNQRLTPVRGLLK